MSHRNPRQRVHAGENSRVLSLNDIRGLFSFMISILISFTLTYGLASI